MTENNSHSHSDDQLDQIIELLLAQDLDENDLLEDLRQDNESLVAGVKGVISLSEEYPGAPQLSSHQRLRLLTEYRSKVGKKEQPVKRRRFSFFQTSQVGWVAAASLTIVVAFLAFRLATGTFQELTASAGIQPSLLPVIILALALIVAAIMFLRRK